MELSPHAQRLAEAAGHSMATQSRALAERAGAVAAELGLEARARHEVELAALLHDVGRVALMEEIADEPGGPSGAALDRLRRHPIRGEQLLEQLGPTFRPIARIVRSCSERWDGRGDPDGLSGEDIPLGARIIAPCAAFEALVADGGPPSAMAVRELWSDGGSRFDPHVVAALTRVVARERAAADERDAAVRSSVRERLGGRSVGVAGS